MQIFSCESNGNKQVNTDFSDTECFTGIYIMHMFFAGISILFLFHIGYYIAILSYDIRFNSKNITARFDIY